jgi:hypothetical protein
MAASTVTYTVTAAASAVSPSSTAARAAPQGGVLEGLNPSQYNASNPIILFIIQVCIQNFALTRYLLFLTKTQVDLTSQ